MMASEPTSLMEHFASLYDPRVLKKNQHNLLDIVVIAICGMICGADDWVSMGLDCSEITQRRGAPISRPPARWRYITSAVARRNEEAARWRRDCAR